MVIVETSFPRGGAIKVKPKSVDIQFGARQQKRKKDKSKKRKKLDNKDAKPKQMKAVSAELLNNKTIQEGMTLIGTIKSVDPTLLKISLPGRLVGHVSATSISNLYNKLMEKYVSDGNDGAEGFQPLPNLFNVGQLVCTKVLETRRGSNGRLLTNLSLKPSDIQSDFNHQHLRKGQLLFGAIEEVQDHGYVIETGVQNLHAFLPYEKSEKGLSVGKVICLKIEKLTQDTNASVAVCKSIENGSRKIKDLEDAKLDYILPTTIVKFTITKILKDGLEGTIMHDTFTAYVNEHHLSEPFQLPSDYSVNSTISAKVLYVMPLSKLVYLSLITTLDTDDEPKLSHGDIVENVSVHRIGTGGIIVDLGGKGKGLISFGSIKSNYSGNYDQDQMLEKYKKNTKLKVRIFDYDSTDRLYTCTDNPTVVNMKIYSLQDVKAGDFVTGVVDKKNASNDYLLKIGNVRGYLQKYFLAPSTNLRKGSKVKCRVVSCNADRNQVYVTNRNEYMSESALVPKDISFIKPNCTFVGTIIKADDVCYTVRFFANIVGIMYKSALQKTDMVSLFEGSTMNFRIRSKQEGKIVVELAEGMHAMGAICEAKVTNIFQHGLEIVMSGEEEQEIKGLVPVRLLSDFQDIVSGRLKTYKLGEEIIVSCSARNLYSVRDVPEYKLNTAPLWKDIAPGDILKACVKNVSGEIVEVMLPIRNFTKTVKIHMNMFLERAVLEPSVMLVPDQVAYVKVLSKDNVSKTLTLSAKLTEVWDRQLKSTGEMFARYLDEVENVKKKFKADSKPLGSYTVGSKVTGKILSFSKIESQWIVELASNVRGLLKGNQNSFIVGKEVKCTILWIDYSVEVLYLSSKPAVCDRICEGLTFENKLKNVDTIKARVVLQTNEFVICTLKKGTNPVVFLPSKLHFNDFENTSVANVNDGDLIQIAFIHDKYPIAVLKSTWKFWKKMETFKRKAEVEVRNKIPTKKSKVLKESEETKNKIEMKRKYVSILKEFDSINNDSGRSNAESFFEKGGAPSKKRNMTPKKLIVATEEEKSSDNLDEDDDESSEDENENSNDEEEITSADGEECDDEDEKSESFDGEDSDD